MNNPTPIAFLHTSASLVPVFKELCEQHLDGKQVEVFHLADDSLILNTIRRGKLTPDTARRVVGHVRSLEEAGARRVVATCSSIGPAVETAAALVDIPVHRIDRPMAEEAVARGTRIGVAATLATTLEPTSELIRRVAGEAGRGVELVTECCEGAFEALMAGDADEHDRRVVAALHKLMDQSGVVVLAQASMARVAERLPPAADNSVPILTSPPLAMKFLRNRLD